MALVRRARPTGALVGRSVERAALEELLARDDVALVTVMGTPGVGKTALVEDVVRARTECVWIDGASIGDGDALAIRVGELLHSGDASIVVLDGVDPLESVVASRFTEWLESETTRFVVTSQMPLELEGEHRFLVAPLSEPDADALYRAVAPHADDAAVRAAVLASDGVPLALIAMAEQPNADPAMVGPWRTAMARAGGDWMRQRSALMKLRVLGASFGLTEANRCSERIRRAARRAHGAGFLHDAGDGLWRMMDVISAASARWGRELEARRSPVPIAVAAWRRSGVRASGPDDLERAIARRTELRRDGRCASARRAGSGYVPATKVRPSRSTQPCRREPPMRQGGLQLS